MSLVISESSQKGGVSVLLFHCFFIGNESITHFMHKLDLELYRALPNLYAVCIAETARKHKKLTAGFVLKTSYTHHDPEFITALTNAVSIEPRLMDITNKDFTFLPARLGITGDTPPTEKEMLKVMMTQVLKHGVAGTA